MKDQFNPQSLYILKLVYGVYENDNTANKSVLIAVIANSYAKAAAVACDHIVRETGQPAHIEYTNGTLCVIYRSGLPDPMIFTISRHIDACTIKQNNK